MTAILLALGSSVGYGVSDFLAGRVAKRVAPVLLVLYSQLLQSVVLLVVVVAVDQPYSAAALGWGTAAGVVLAGVAVTSLASAERDEEVPAPTWHGPPATRRRVAVPRPPLPVVLALVAAVAFGLFFVGVDLGGAAAQAGA
jgi:hypothetical protein